jgi:hypothetical protein
VRVLAGAVVVPCPAGWADPAPPGEPVAVAPVAPVLVALVPADLAADWLG